MHDLFRQEQNRYVQSMIHPKSKEPVPEKVSALTVRCIPVAIKTQLSSGGSPDNELHGNITFCCQFLCNTVEFVVTFVDPHLFGFKLCRIFLQIRILMRNLFRRS